MRTLTHEPLALAAALIITIAFVAGLTVQVALRIKTRSGRKARPAGAGTEQPSMPLGATGPGVVSMRLATPGPDTKTRPSAMGGGRSAGYARGTRTPRAAEAEVHARTEAADMAPEGAPAALSGATPGDSLVRDFRAWQDAGKPGTWPISVVPGEGEQS